MRHLALIFTAFLLFFPASATAEIDCEAQPDKITEAISSYLEKYQDNCIKTILKERLKKYKIKEKQEQEQKKTQSPPLLIHAWHESVSNFEKLAEDAADNSHMNEIYKQLAKRAKLAKAEIELAGDLKLLPDIAAARHGAWQKSVHLTLPRLEIHGRQVSPFLDIKGGIDKDCADRGSTRYKETVKQGRKLMLELLVAHRVSAAAGSETIKKITKQISDKNDIWNTYLYDSKPMLPPDIFFTDLFNRTWFKSDQYSNGFRIPPKTQFFFLHPSPGLEYVPEATDGSQLMPMVYVEIFGANRWDKADRWIGLWPFNYLSGFSVIFSYADRAGSKDEGWGGLFTFNNTYSVGITDYDGETGAFFSLDLANLWREKYKPRYEKYKNELENLTSKAD